MRDVQGRRSRRRGRHVVLAACLVAIAGAAAATAPAARAAVWQPSPGHVQTAISHQVKGLEQRLGMPLFRRSNRGLTLTDEGLALAPTLFEAFGAIDRLFEQFEAGGVREVLTVSAVGAFVSQLQPAVGAPEQGLAEPQFEALHLMADRRLGHTQLIGRPGERQVARGGLEGPQRIQGDRGAHGLSPNLSSCFGCGLILCRVGLKQASFAPAHPGEVRT